MSIDGKSMKSPNRHESLKQKRARTSVSSPCLWQPVSQSTSNSSWFHWLDYIEHWSTRWCWSFQELEMLSQNIWSATVPGLRLWNLDVSRRRLKIISNLLSIVTLKYLESWKMVLIAFIVGFIGSALSDYTEHKENWQLLTDQLWYISGEGDNRVSHETEAETITGENQHLERLAVILWIINNFQQYALITYLGCSFLGSCWVTPCKKILRQLRYCMRLQLNIGHHSSLLTWPFLLPKDQGMTLKDMEWSYTCVVVHRIRVIIGHMPLKWRHYYSAF